MSAAQDRAAALRRARQLSLRRVSSPPSEWCVCIYPAPAGSWRFLALRAPVHGQQHPGMVQMDCTRGVDVGSACSRVRTMSISSPTFFCNKSGLFCINRSVRLLRLLFLACTGTGYRSKKFKYKLALWHTLISHFTVPGPAVCPPPQAAKKKSPISYMPSYFLEISKAGDPSIS